MRPPSTWQRLAAAALVACALVACEDGEITHTSDPSATTGPGSGGSGGAPSTSVSAGGSGATGAAGGGTGTGGAGGAGTGGGEAKTGVAASDLVSAGDEATSTNYKLIHTFGQPTQHQKTLTSPSYRLQGGLVGATGNLP